MIKYEIKYENILALMRLLKQLKDYIESDFYMEFSPPEENSSEEDFVYGVQNELEELYCKLLLQYADKTKYRIMDNRELFD